MKRGLVLSLATMAVALLSAGAGQAATVTLSLDLYYGDGADADKLADNTQAGSWQLVARSSTGDNRGIAGVDTALTGVVNAVGATGSTFRAPNGAATVGGVAGQAGFQTTYDAKTWAQDQDADALTADMLFGQVPVGTPNQGLFYDVGNPANPSAKNSGDAANGQPAVTGLASVVSWNFDDSLGDRLGDGNQANNNGAYQRGVILAQGRFNAGAAPAFAAGGTAANVFTVLGTAAAAPGTGTIQSATVVTEVRNNLGQKRADANLDGDVDVFQIDGKGDAQVTSSNFGKSGNMLWQDGDFNGDKDVDVFQIDGKGDAQILSSSFGADAPAGQAIATYFAATGQVKLDIGTGIAVAGFGVTGGINPGAAALLNGTPPAQKDADTLAYFSATGLPVGIHDLGLAFLPGKTAADITFSITPVGQDTVAGTLIVVPVPEPGTIAMFGIAATLLVGAVRKNRAA